MFYAKDSLEVPLPAGGRETPRMSAVLQLVVATGTYQTAKLTPADLALFLAASGSAATSRRLSDIAHEQAAHYGITSRAQAPKRWARPGVPSPAADAEGNPAAPKAAAGPMRRDTRPPPEVVLIPGPVQPSASARRVVHRVVVAPSSAQ